MFLSYYITFKLKKISNKIRLILFKIQIHDLCIIEYFRYKLHGMMKMYSKYDNVHAQRTNGILEYTNNDKVRSKYYMLSVNNFVVFSNSKHYDWKFTTWTSMKSSGGYLKIKL